MDKNKLNQNLKPILAAFYHWEEEQANTVFLRQPYGKSWKEFTYAQVGQQARRLCTALQNRGIQAGDHVGILSKNCYQ